MAGNEVMPTEVDLFLPWAWRSEKYDDWGTIRDSRTYPVLDGCCGIQYTDLEADEARRTKTVPPRVQAICEYTVRAVNAHDDLVEALKATVEAYCDLANSGDCGFWDPEITDEVKQARAALRKALSPSVPEVK